MFIECGKHEDWKSIEDKVKTKLGYGIKNVNHNIIQDVYEKYRTKKRCKSIERNLKNFI